MAKGNDESNNPKRRPNRPSNIPKGYELDAARKPKDPYDAGKKKDPYDKE